MPLPVQNLSASQEMENPPLQYDSAGEPYYQSIPIADKTEISPDQIKTLADKYSGKSIPAATEAPDVSTLAAKYNVKTNAAEATTGAASNSTAQNIAAGAGQGIKDVGASLLKMILSDNPEYSAKAKDVVTQQNQQFQQQYGDSTAASVARMGGQIAASTPAMKGIEGINIASKAVPAIVNKFGTAVTRGAAAGGIFGATTSSTNEEGLGANVAENALAGGVAGPIVAAGGAALSKIIPAGKAMWAKFGPIQQLANTSGAPASAVRNVIDILENAGFTPDTAQQALTKMGPQATLADLDPSITTELSGIASLGGKPTAIAKGRMLARADTADSQAKSIVTKELGPKPDIDAEKQKIYNQAIKDVGPNYDSAYKSGNKLDVSDLVGDIKDKIKTAVGPKESILKVAGSYFLRKDAQGKFTSELKDTIPELHEIRMALDDTIEKSKIPSTSAGKNALKALTDIREGVDEKLKSNPEMKAADEKFAEKMKVKKALDLDWTEGNKEEFANKFVNSTADEQAAIRKKMTADIHDTMENAARGELAGAQQQFGKKSTNRAKLKIAFGDKADNVLDALANEGAQRATERAVSQGSQTAERSAIQRKYGEAPAPGYGHEIAKGLAFDIAGGHGAASVYMAGKKYVGSHIIKFSENRLGALREGTADILSRQGLGRNTALSAMTKVSTIQKSVQSNNPKIKLPISASPVLGQAGYNEYKKITGGGSY